MNPHILTKITINSHLRTIKKGSRDVCKQDSDQHAYRTTDLIATETCRTAQVCSDFEYIYVFVFCFLELAKGVGGNNAHYYHTYFLLFWHLNKCFR